MDYIDNDQHDLLVRPVVPPGDVRKDLFVDAPGGLTFTAGQDRSSGQLIEVLPELPPEENAFVWIQVWYQGAFFGTKEHSVIHIKPAAVGGTTI